MITYQTEKLFFPWLSLHRRNLVRHIIPVMRYLVTVKFVVVLNHIYITSLSIYSPSGLLRLVLEKISIKAIHTAHSRKYLPTPQTHLPEEYKEYSRLRKNL